MVEFVAAVLAKLPTIPDQRDLDFAISCIGDCEKQGFTISEAYLFVRNLEHVNPELEEDYALKEMARIKALVKVRQSKEAS